MGRAAVNMGFDYIFPNFIAKALRKPSMKTQMEATMVGLVMMLITSLGTSGYIVFFSSWPVFFKVISVISEIGIVLFMGSFLVTSYMQYHAYKAQMGLYEALEGEKSYV